jgi:hypothetical protein
LRQEQRHAAAFAKTAKIAGDFEDLAAAAGAGALIAPLERCAGIRNIA